MSESYCIIKKKDHLESINSKLTNTQEKYEKNAKLSIDQQNQNQISKHIWLK